jgi:hypothetical protein
VFADGNHASIHSSKPLLDALKHMTQLHHLELQDCYLNQQQRGTINSQCFSALTASTQLTALVLIQQFRMPVPKEAFIHMFPAGRVLPHLKLLHFAGGIFTDDKLSLGAKEVKLMGAACPVCSS